LSKFPTVPVRQIGSALLEAADGVLAADVRLLLGEPGEPSTFIATKMINISGKEPAWQNAFSRVFVWFF
jgi:hypothetical protein